MSGADTSHTARFDNSVGVIRMNHGFGMTAVGIPRTSTAPAEAPSAISQNRASSVARTR